MSIINQISTNTIRAMTQSPGALEEFRKSFPNGPVSLATWVASKTESLHFYYKYIQSQRIPDVIRTQLRLLSVECAEKALPFHNRVSFGHPEYGPDLIGSSSPASLVIRAKQLVKAGVNEEDMNNELSALRSDVLRRRRDASYDFVRSSIPVNRQNDNELARYAMDITSGAGRSDGDGLCSAFYLDRDIYSWLLERLHEICLNWEVEVIAERERANQPTAKAQSLAQPRFGIMVTYTTEKRVKPVTVQLDLNWSDRARTAEAMLAIQEQHLLFLDTAQSAQDKIVKAINAPWGPNAKLKTEWTAYLWVRMDDLSRTCVDTSWNSDGCRLTALALVELPVEILF